ncbi:MAG: DUF2099 family protein [bacterium]|nr:DUF2099 family protein [bacterium]
MVSVDKQDIHILKYFSAMVTVVDGQVTKVTDPSLVFCPLANHLYKDFKNIRKNYKESLKKAIKGAIEKKIRDYGLFTAQRHFNFPEVSIPYGASEMLMYALKKKAIEAAVVVCDGAGTVIANTPEIVQGIGARMNSLILTSPIKETIKKLEKSGCQVIFKNALIDQYHGVREAIQAGHKNIAVTINGDAVKGLKELRSLEKRNNVSITSLVLCTTGIAGNEIALIRDYADLVWSCASQDIRRIAGTAAIMQLSRQIPVFVLTNKGVSFVSAYANESETIKNIDPHKQYLIDHTPGKQYVHLGGIKAFISESDLPVSGRSEPSFSMNI